MSGWNGVDWGKVAIGIIVHVDSRGSTYVSHRLPFLNRPSPRQDEYSSIVRGKARTRCGFGILLDLRYSGLTSEPAKVAFLNTLAAAQRDPNGTELVRELTRLLGGLEGLGGDDMTAEDLAKGFAAVPEVCPSPG